MLTPQQVYVALRLYAASKLGELPGKPPVPRLSRAMADEIGNYFEVEVKRITGLDSLSRLEQLGPSGGVLPGYPGAIEPAWEFKRKGRLPPEFAGGYDGVVLYGVAKGILDAWGEFLLEYQAGVELGGDFDAAGLLDEAHTRFYWSALARFCAKLGVWDALALFRVGSAWQRFVQGLEQLPEQLGEAAAAAADALAKAGGRGIAAFLGALLTSPGGLLLVGAGVAAWVYRGQLTRAVARLGMGA